ncbi:MAG: hypothetical protein U5K76_16185 [Woeseiaceae bacterium]|nr:hypothetical protein [Woeseiaceae bacterium]
MKLKTPAILSGVILSLVAGSALACGESLFRVGKGVAFRQYTAPLPGSILAVAKTEAELLMIEQLVAAGHDVHVVAEPSQIRDELGEHEFDIVLAYYRQRDVVAAQTRESRALYIPVAMRDTGEEREAADRYERSLASDDSVKTFLKTIHRALKARG